MDRPISLSLRSVDLASEPAFQLGSALVDPQAHECVIGDTATHLQPQTLKVLVALHDKSGHVVTREELIDRCWNGRIVGDDVINRCISLLRPIAAKSGGFRIETIPRSGYRLIEMAGEPGRKSSRSLLLLGAACALLLAVIGMSAFVDRRTAAPQAAADPALVEVQPLSASAEDHAALALGEGMGSSIERDLEGSGTAARIIDAGYAGGGPSLQVRGTSIDDQGELRASLQLMWGRSGNVVWAANFHRPVGQFDQLQDQLSLQVARELHCAYADGRAPYFDRDFEFARLSLAHCDTLGVNFDEAVRLDNQIVQRAPGFARGWAEFAMDTALASESLPPLLRAAGDRHAIELARRSLALDPHQGLAYTAIIVSTYATAPWSDTERLARQAIAADPTSPEAHAWHSILFGMVGRVQDALNESRLAYQFDHFLPGKVDQLARINAVAGFFQDSEDALTQARRFWPTHPWIDSDEILLGLEGFAPDHSLALLARRGLAMSDARRAALMAVLKWRVASGQSQRDAAIKAVEAAAAADGVNPEQVWLLALLGDVDEAYQLADRLPLGARADARWFGPGADAFLSDPRFMSLAARVGIAQAWLQTGLWPDFCTVPGKLVSCRSAAAAAVSAAAKGRAFAIRPPQLS